MPRLSKIGAAALAAFGWTSGDSAVSASYLVVAGGGGASWAGGGGAGGYRTDSISLNPTLSYTVTVGAGGAQAVSGVGNNGSDSVFSTITSSGGGYGRYNVSAVSAGSGGSGGGIGGQAGTQTAGSGNTPSTSPSQGNNGGTGSGSGGGGGGGASAVGQSIASTTGGNGGAGTASSITGTSVTYAGGGGGGGSGAGGTGGAGGGGAGSTTVGTAGTANLGGGGGGGWNTNGGNGGSGVVIISYPAPQKFGGGIIVTDGGSTIIHIFNTSGVLSPLSSLSANYLVVAGGAGGGNSGSTNPAGGGGAGGLLTGSGAVIDTNSIYLVQVGAGGAGSTASNTAGTNGVNSYFSGYTTTAIGGGGGSSGTGAAVTGGSGGGGNYGSQTGAGVTVAGQGFAGGNAFNGANYTAGGGGGAGAVGVNGTSTAGGNGGVGIASSISGTSTFYAGGGGGAGPSNSGNTAGVGGNGGGGNGGRGTTVSAPTSGTANTGGGGGGGGYAFAQDGGAGGSGIIIISYAGSTQLMAGGTVTISGGNVIHTFTSSGYLTPLKLVNNSLRFRSSASAYLSRTPATASNRKTWTWSGWVKRGSSAANVLFMGGATQTDTGATCITFYNDILYIQGYNTNWLVTTQVFRDYSAWYHIVVAMDSTNSTANNRLRLYVNGVEVTSFSTRNNLTQNTDYGINQAALHTIAYQSVAFGNTYFDGEQTEINFVDGQALTPNSFGTFNSYGVWQPITYGGSYGTNGFYLPMNPGSSTYAAPFNGTSQLISVPANAAFNFTGNFTAECWANTSTITNATQPTLFTIGSDGAGLVVGFYAGTFYCYMLGSGGLMSAATLPLNQWVHVAWVRVSGVNTLYLNGVASATASVSGTLSSTGGVTVGRTGSSGSAFQYFQGSVSNFRVNNTALYTANFTPPTSPLTAVSGTQLLTLQNATIIDNSTNAFTITNTGSVATVVAYPFNLNKTIDYSPAGNNWTNNNIGTVTGTTLDVMTDVPTLTSATAANYPTLNPLALPPSGYTAGTFLSGNLQFTTGGVKIAKSTMAIPLTGKWYIECRSSGTSASIDWIFGLTGMATTTPVNHSNPGVNLYISDTAYWLLNAVTQFTQAGAISSSDVFQIAYDSSTGKVWLGKNNTYYTAAGAGTGNPSSGTNEFGTISTTTEYCAYTGGNSGTTTSSINFGQQPFVYTPPTNFVALNTYNL